MDFEDHVQQTFFDPIGMENRAYRKSATYERIGAKLYQENGR